MSRKQIEVVSIAQCGYQPSHHILSHYHHFFHMFYIISGKGYMRINSNIHNIGSKQLFLCSPCCVHELECDNDSWIKTIEAKFFIYDKNILKYLNNIDGIIDIDPAEIKNILENALDEAINKGYLYIEIVNNEIFNVLLRISRKLESKNRDNTFPACIFNVNSYYKGVDFGSIISFIEKNLKSSLSLEILARQVGLNPTYFCRMFKEKYEISPIRFINNLRIKKAKELMIQTSLNITEIAEMVGFQSVHYFSRYFKDREKISPIEYRQKLCNSVYVTLYDCKNSYINAGSQ